MLAAAVAVAWIPAADASCNQIPGTANAFRGAVGTVDRPFAGPGDFVEVRLSPTCDAASPGLSGIAAPVVTVAFRPPGREPDLVVLAPDCDALGAAVAACAARPGVGTAVCRAADGSDVSVVERDGQARLRFRFPDTDALVGGATDDRTLAGPAAIAVSRSTDPLPCAVATAPCAGQPAGLTACIDALFTLDGTCGTTPDGVFPSFTALPPPNDYQALCVDPAGVCTARATELRFALDADGNLLLPMDWRGVLPPRAAAAESDRALPPARLLRLAARLDAFGDGRALLRVPGPGFLRAYAPNGGLLPPVFEPQVDPGEPDRLVLFGSADAPQTVLRLARRSPVFRACAGGGEAGRPCTADADCPAGSCATAHCAGGAADGSPCAGDGDCPAGECGAALFDLRPLAADGTGVLPRFGRGFCQDSQVACTADGDCESGRCVAFRALAEEPVPLEGLIESPELLIAVVPEALDGRDLNGDGDATDEVLLLYDRRTGMHQPTGTAGADGRAAARITVQPFAYPEVATEGDVVAFLEAEPLQGGGDRNGDGDEFDTLLRVFRRGAGGAQELTRDLELAVDPAPRVDGRGLALADGVLWFRLREADAARLAITRVSRAADGGDADGPSRHPALAAAGRYVAFESRATNITDPPGDGLATYVFDRSAETTAAVVADAATAIPQLTAPAISGDGRHVVGVATAANGTQQIFAVDRDGDGNGVLDEPGTRVGQPVSDQDDGSGFGVGDSLAPSLTADGRFAAFISNSDRLGADGGRSSDALHYRVWRRDRDPDGDGIYESAATGPPVVSNMVSINNSGGAPSAPALRQAPAISADGRVAAFADFDANLAPRDDNYLCLNPTSSTTNCADVLVRDAAAGTTRLASVSSAGEQVNRNASTPALSADGRCVAFLSSANNLVPGDTNDAADVFVRDRLAGTTERVSVASDGTQGDAASFDRTIAMSPDGRFVAFGSAAATLVTDDANVVCDNDFDGAADDNCPDVFVHDRLTGFTRKISRAPDGGDGDGRSGSPSLAADGVTVAFESTASNLVAGDGNRATDVFVAAPDDGATGADLTGDGDVADAVLVALDTRQPDPRPQVLVAAAAASVGGDCAVALTPEGDGGVDLDGDGDLADTVAQLACLGAAPVSLGLAADEAVLLADAIAVRASEAGAGRDLDGDGDRDDAVVHVARRDAPTDWRNLALPATRLGGHGGVVAFLVDEASAGDRNGDGDADDQVLHVWFAADGAVVNVGQAAEDFVIGDRLLAFRTSEAHQGGASLNGDDDADDAVLQVFDLERRQLLSSGQAATPCRFSACDPRFPYRVFDDTVKFLTFEREQGTDLTGNGTIDELVLQTFNVRAVPVAAALRRGAAAAAAVAPATSVVAAVRAGICADDGRACTVAADCGPGSDCLSSAGVCEVDRGVACNPEAEVANPCAGGQFCVPQAPGVGTCHERVGSCATNDDCPPRSRCTDSSAALRRAADPLYRAGAGAQVVTAAGVCVERLTDTCAGGCAAGAACVEGACERSHGACRIDADCPPATRCRPQLVVAAAADADADGIADPFDNCPSVANVGQGDADGDGVGDACSAAAPPPPPTPTVAPRRTADHDGCAVVAPSSATAGAMPLAGLLLLLAARRRCRRDRSH